MCVTYHTIEMELQYYLPQANLRDYVRVYYYFATDVASVQPLCAELGNIRILLNGSGDLYMPGADKPTRITSTFLIGPTMGAYTMHADAGTCVFGIGIRPRGWIKMFSVNAYEAADQVFDLSKVARRVAGGVLDEVHKAADPHMMAAICDRYFAALLERRSKRHNPYPQAIEDWLLHDETLDLDRLLTMTGVSRRQTERLAKKHFGGSPKLLQRKYRALRAADTIRAGKSPWQNAAGPGYYDQSHFIKEFKTFIGVTPAQYFTAQTALMREVQEKRSHDIVHAPLASV